MAAKFVQGALQQILELYFKAGTAPTAFKVGLCTDLIANVANNAVLGDLTELASTGYARRDLTRDGTGFPTSQASSTNAWELASAAVTFSNSSGGAWTTANSAFICTAAGVLVAVLGLSTPRTLQNGDSLTLTFTSLKLTEG